MPFDNYGQNTTLQDIITLRRRDKSTISSLEIGKRQGRDVTGIRATPSSASDVIQGDALGDFVNTSTHEYELIQISGSLLWAKRNQDTVW